MSIFTHLQPKIHKFYRQYQSIFVFLALFGSSFLVSAEESSENPQIMINHQENASEFRQLLQLVEYIAVDYNSAVSSGKVIDRGEYAEMLEFSTIVANKSLALAEQTQQIVALSKSLKSAVEEKLSTERVQKLATGLKKIMLGNSPSLLLPENLLAELEVQQIFQNNCANCHGTNGYGNGQLAAQLEPKPTNFSDYERAMNRSVMGLYNVISGGLEGTAMQAYTQLNSRQRWSLAFYVGSFAFEENPAGFDIDLNSSKVSLNDVISFSPNEIIANQKQADSRVIYQVKSLRAKPRMLFKIQQDPFVVAHAQLAKALKRYKNGDITAAKQLAVSAYLDGFELVENSLDAHDKVFRKEIERKLLSLRSKLNKSDNLASIEHSMEEITILLNRANKLLNEQSMSDSTLFSASFIILLREGLEALLIVLALMTILMRSGKKDALKFIHVGWVSALLAGFATWLVAQYLIEISGASREIMEGGVGFVAAIILFYMGFWMHSQSHSANWQGYIKTNINRSLTSGALWGIAGLSFISVYREVFETVLFYQSLLTQASDSQGFVLVIGFVAALICLALIGWGMIRYSVKLPIARFFASTTYLLLALSFILMGKAIAALQEAAIINLAPMPFEFQVDWLGINSTWQGVVAQLTILLLSILLVVRRRFKRDNGT